MLGITIIRSCFTIMYDINKKYEFYFCYNLIRQTTPILRRLLENTLGIYIVIIKLNTYMFET